MIQWKFVKSFHPTLAVMLHRHSWLERNCPKISKVYVCPERMHHAPCWMSSVSWTNNGTFWTIWRYISSNHHHRQLPVRSLQTGALDQKYYSDQDLAIGQLLNVFGRKVLLTDCDDFTKNYYRTRYGVQDFTPINYKKSSDYQPLKQSYPCKNRVVILSLDEATLNFSE